LPPGYRIECGEGNPSHIRVTTPMGTTLQPISAGKFNFAESSQNQSGSNSGFFSNRSNSWQQSQPQASIESPEAQFSAPAVGGPGAFGQGQSSGQQVPFEGPGSAQQQRGTSQVPSSTPNAPGQRNALTPTPGNPGTQGSANSGNGQNANMEKRGPVEFNHAISYVNKIKVS
jgi:paired amphipathic helix protein Sin3a